MTVLVEVLAGILFFALIILSVLLHECGHFIPAKIFGVKVTEFFAGFGPKMWSVERGETEYGFKWIPLGGYVRLVGMYPAEAESSPTCCWPSCCSGECSASTVGPPRRPRWPR